MVMQFWEWICCFHKRGWGEGGWRGGGECVLLQVSAIVGDLF